MPFDLAEALRDPGYPGFSDARVRRFTFFEPLARMSERDLERFWLLEYRWPNGVTPLGLVFLEDGLQWAGQYAAWRLPLPPSNGIDYRLVGTHFYSAELPQLSDFECDYRATRLADRLPEFIANFESRWATTKKHLLVGVRALETYETSGRSLAELARYLADARSFSRHAWEIHFEYTYPLVMIYSELRQLCIELGLPEDTAKRVLQGYPSRATETDERLWQLVGQVRMAGAAGAVTGAPASSVRERLGAFPKLIAEANRFLGEHGWRTETVADPLARPWIEDETAFWGTIHSSLLAGAAFDVATSLARAAAERTTSIDAAHARLTTAERATFDRALADCTQANFVWWSEDHNLLIDTRAFIPVRRAALAIGRALDLSDPEDSVFCFYDELEQLCDGSLRWHDVASQVTDRRAYYRHWREIRNEMPKYLGTPPATIADPIMVEIDGITDDFLAAVRRGHEKLRELKGLPAAAGTAVGRARVLHSPDDLHLLRGDDILVCEGTTSSWTPAFTRVAGCICDQGGTLSHAAIISREYGVPCIVGVASATTVIRDGDTVELDGATGVVRVLESATDRAA